MRQSWSEDAMRQAIADLVEDAVPETYAAQLTELSTETGIPRATIDNRFRRERGAPELALQGNSLRAHARRAAETMPDGIELAGWSPAVGTLVSLGIEPLAFVDYDRLQSGVMFLVNQKGAITQLHSGDHRIENVLKQISIAFSAELVASR